MGERKRLRGALHKAAPLREPPPKAEGTAALSWRKPKLQPIGSLRCPNCGNHPEFLSEEKMNAEMSFRLLPTAPRLNLAA